MTAPDIREVPASDCESVRGEWGGICPDCGHRLPPLVDGPPSEKLRHVIRWNTDGPEWSEKRKATYLRTGK